MRNYEIIIVGAGPAGSATALQLASLNPGLAPETLLLDKAIFPRPKLCAGGVTTTAELVLKQCGVSLDLPAAAVHATKFILPDGTLTFQRPNHFRVFRREEFDQHLFRVTHERGVCTGEGEAVDKITRADGGVIVRTSRNEYRAKILIGADGANSMVRRSLGLRRGRRLMMALEIFVPAEEFNLPGVDENLAVFDFSLTAEGFPGYCWAFPTVRQGPPVVSLGIMEAPFGETPNVPLKDTFACWLRRLGVDLSRFDLKGHPALRYEPRASCSSPRVLLAGDAAGIDPLFGEGITSALAEGSIAACAAHDALLSGDFSFADYEKRIRSSLIGGLMRRRRILARRLYNFPAIGRRYTESAALLKWITLSDPDQRFWTLTPNPR